MTLYLNGQPDGGQAVSYDHVYASTAAFMLGANLENGAAIQHFDGLLDEWRVYDRALSQAEVQALMATSPPQADFGAAPLAGTAPLTVSFANLTDGAATYLWDLGDEITSTLVSPAHVYTGAGVYTVSLTADGPGGSDTLTRTNYITVTGGTAYTTTTRVITYTYDKLYRLTEADYRSTGLTAGSTGERFEYGYDAVGNRTALTQTVGVSQTVHSYQYDQANRLVNVDGQAYTWDANGNLLSDGARSSVYDAANRLTSVTSGTLTTTFEYDGLGNRMAQSVDGVETRYALDVAGGLPEVIVATTGGASA
jgi:YD repeat-containing protein